MNGVLRSIDNSGHIGHTYILNTNAKWKLRNPVSAIHFSTYEELEK